MKSDTSIVKRKIKIFINGLQENDPEIMPDPPAKYLENDKCDQINRIFPTTFICQSSLVPLLYFYNITMYYRKNIHNK